MTTFDKTRKPTFGRSMQILAAGVIAVLACGESGPAADWTVVRDTLPSGVERVTNTPAPADAPTWTLVEEIRVGTIEADRPESFGEIKGLVGLEGGGFAVLESQAMALRVFAADGSHLATHGQQGEGPGEFMRPNGMGWHASRLWVKDPMPGRLTFFDVATGAAETIQYRPNVPGSLHRWTPYAVLANGQFVAFPEITTGPGGLATASEIPSSSRSPRGPCATR